MQEKSVPALYEWAGGVEAFERLTEIFYRRVLEDPLLYPLFAEMSPEHPQRVAWFINEVFGGSKTYSERRGGHKFLLAQHLNRHLTEAQRRRWAQLIGEAADEAGLPADPEFRAAFVGYIEWGTRIAVETSQPGVTLPEENPPMPQWDWGAASPAPGSTPPMPRENGAKEEA